MALSRRLVNFAAFPTIVFISLVLADQAAAQTLTSITATPANPTIADGQTQQFVATGTFSDSSTEVLSTNVWHFEDPLPTARCQTTAVELNGKVYAIGGRTDCHEGMGTPLNTVDVFDSVLDTWTAGTPMPTARNELTATAVNGRIYVIGGIDGQDEKKVEIFDPATNSWSTGANMPTGRIAMGAAVVNGKIYVAGGCIKQATPDDATCPLATLEIYDPSNNTWTPGASMSTVRDTLGVAALKGKIYAVGGSSGPALLASGEVFDPITNSWTPIAPMPTARSQLRLTALNGLLYAIGGEVQTGPNTAAASTVVEVYDPTTNTWSTAPSLLTARGGHGVVVVNGQIGVGGGFGTNNAALSSVEVFTPPLPANAGTWATKAPAPYVNRSSSVVLNGKIYVFGSDDGSGNNQSRVYDPATNTWTVLAPRPIATGNPSAATVNGLIYVFGGYNLSPCCADSNSTQEYDPVANSWATRSNMPTARSFASAAAVDGKIYVLGGNLSDVAQNVNEMYDPATNSWTTKQAIPAARSGAAVGVINGKIYLVGGFPSPFNKNEQYDPTTDTWATRSVMPTGRSEFGAAVVGGKIYTVGGVGSGAYTNNNEEYDPVADTWIARAPIPVNMGGNTGAAVNAMVYTIGINRTQGSDQVNYAFTPPGEVVWSSSNGGVATIDLNGLATAIGPGTSTITATQTGGSISGSTLLSVAPPTIASVFPPSAQAGSVVTITGTGFGSTQSGSTVTIGGVPASILSWSDTEIVAQVPAGAEGTNQAVAVTVNGQGSNPQTLTSVTPGIASLSISPSNPTIAVGQTQPFTITARFTDYPTTPDSEITIPVPFGIKILGGAQRSVAIDPATGSVTPSGPVLSTFTGASAGPSALDVQGQRGYVVIGGNIITVDGENEVVLSTNPMPTGVSSLEFDSTQNKLLGVALLDHDSNSGTPRRNVLVEVTPSTGALTMIGTGADPFPEVSAGVSAIDPAGHRYFVTLANSLVIFNTVTGAAASIALPQTPSSMEYDSGENRLFGIALVGGVNKLGWIDPADTGQFNIIGPMAGLPGPQNVSAGVATLDPANNRYYVSFAGQFHTIDTTAGNILSSAPFSGVSSLLFHPLLRSDNPAVATVTQNPSATGVSPGTTTITATVGDADASTLLTVVVATDLSIAKSDAPDPVSVGTPLTYTVTVTNNGPNAATNVVVTDTLPAGVSYDDAGSDTRCSGPASGPVTCAIGTLANGANSGPITIATFAPTAPMLAINTATVSATEVDLVPGNNTATAQTVVRSASPTADLAVTITDTPDPVQRSQTFTYTLTVRNNGPDVATGVQLGGLLAATAGSPIANSVTPSQGSCLGVGTQTPSCNLGTIGINATATVVLTTASNPSGFVTLTASTDGTTTDPNTANNTSIVEQTTVWHTTFTVNSINDVVDVNGCDVTHCSLREAINAANATMAPDLIAFNIPGAGMHTIAPTSALPTITNPVVIDGTTQPGASANTLAIGNNAVLLIELNGASAGTGINGLKIFAGNSRVRGLVVNRFGGIPASGIVLDTNGGNVIEGNYIGTNAAGNAALGNGYSGITIANSPNNTIGGLTPSARNVVSGNAVTGIFVTGAGNLVQGNFIGTDASGSAPVANGGDGVGIFSPAMNNIIGGTTAAARNVISGNTGAGVEISGGGTTGNQIKGNYIGTNAEGMGALANGQGVLITNLASANTIGGTAAGTGNLISGNSQEGIVLTGATSGSVVQGNFIGTTVNGNAPLPNNGAGVRIDGSSWTVSNNTIGGTTVAARNVISGNSGNGVEITGTGATGNLVQGNFIGTNAAGTTALANGSRGIFIDAPNNTIGGTTAAGNLISGNGQEGVLISGSGATGNLVQGNLIGTNAAGTAALGNRFGVGIVGAAGNTVGGTIPGARNVIAGSTGSGVYIQTGANSNTVQGNFIGTNAAGTAALGNGTRGVIIFDSAPLNTIGGTTPEARNIISGNATDGILLADTGTTGNLVQGNFIGTNAAGTGPIPNMANGVVLFSGASNNTIGGMVAGARNVISGNSGGGVDIVGAGVMGNMVAGNFIGTSAAGTAALANSVNGVLIRSGASNNTIGGTTAASRNVISGNAGDGILIADPGTTGNVVQGNFIGTNSTGTSPVGNSSAGVELSAPNNTVGGMTPSARNIISGNLSGVFINGSTGNQVLGNFIGTNAAGTAAIPNSVHGIAINYASNNIIGGTAGTTPGGPCTGSCNLISGTTGDGIGIGGTASGNQVQGNFIGTDAAGTAPLGNLYGIFISPTGVNNAIGGTTAGAANVIAFNGADGVAFTAGTGNAILSNAIFSNGELGIDLGDNGVTANDAGDGDGGPNNTQNFPVLTVATQSASTVITGTLNSTANTTFRVEFFANTACDASGHGEGQTFLGFTNVTTNGSGNAPINVTLAPTVPLGQVVTATATDTNNNTSEFSQCVTVTSAVVVNQSPVLTTAAQTVNEGAALTVTLTATDPETQPVTFMASGLPDGATFNGTNQLTWTPAPNQSGTYAIQVTLSDGVNMPVQALTITVMEFITDTDLDGIPDPPGVAPYGSDNCPTVFNPTQVDFDGDGLGDLCDPSPIGDPFVETGGIPDPKVTNEAQVVPPANGTAYQPEEPIFITANVTFRRVDRDGDGISDPYFAVRPDPFNVFLDVVQCPAGTTDCHNPAGTRVHVNRIPEAPALHIPNSLIEIPGGSDPCPPDTVQIDAPGTPEYLACQAATVINVTETRTAFTGGGVLAITPTYFNYIQDPEYNPVATPETPKCTTPMEGCYSPVWMGKAEAPRTMVQVTPPPPPGTPPPPLLAPHVAVVPTTWDLTWEFTPSSGVVDVYVGNLSNGFTVNQVQAGQVRLNGSVSPAFQEVLMSFSGFSGPVLHLRYNKTEVMRSLRALASRNFVPEGDQEPALLTGVLTADGHPGEQVALFRATPLVQLKDLAAPRLTTPTAITVNATSAAGAVVTYTATATDVFDATPTVGCTPPSGSTFPIGTTTVTCTATDDAGNTATKTFPVMVTNAVTQINALIAKVQGLSGVSTKLKDDLIGKLTNAKKELAHGKVAVACLRLTDFITKVNKESGKENKESGKVNKEKESDKELTVAQANDLRADATRIKAVLGCP